MFTTLDFTLAYGRREEMAREVISGRLDSGARAARGRRRRRWSLMPVQILRAPSDAEVARAGSA